MSTICKSCGAALSEGAGFCGECGSRVEPLAPLCCKSCGAVLSEGAGFCGECGTPVKAEATEAQPGPEPKPEPQPQPQPPRPQIYAPAPARPADDPKTRVVGFGTFFGLHFLFSIPVIGWLACLIMTFVPKNKNVRHYALAMLLWTLIGIGALVGVFFLIRWLGGELKELIDGAMGDIMDQIPDIGGFESLPGMEDLPIQ